MAMIFIGSQPLAKRSIGSDGFNGWKATSNGANGMEMVFGETTIGLDGMAMVFNAMVANHWSNDLLVTNHRSGSSLTPWTS